MGCNIDNLKACDIVRTPSHKQYFFVHKVDGDRITTSGIDIRDGPVFTKGICLRFDKLVPENERHIFYDEIAKRNYKFNVNTGVKVY